MPMTNKTIFLFFGAYYIIMASLNCIKINSILFFGRLNGNKLKMSLK